MATHSSIPAWKSPWTEEPGGLQSMGLHDWACVHKRGGRWVGSNKVVELKKKRETHFPLPPCLATYLAVYHENVINQVGFISEIQIWFNIRKPIQIIYLNKAKTEKALDHMHHLLIIETFRKTRNRKECT